MTDAEIRTLAERVLDKELKPHGLERIEVRTDRGDPDDPALYVEAFMQPGVRSIGRGIASSAHHLLSEKLLESGENRFPYFLIRYTDKDVLERGTPEQ